jgi:hypothetical protein
VPEAYFLPLRALRRLLPAPRIIMQVSGIIASHYHNTAMYFVSGHRDSSLLQHPDSSLHKYSRILYTSSYQIVILSLFVFNASAVFCSPRPRPSPT